MHNQNIFDRGTTISYTLVGTTMSGGVYLMTADPDPAIGVFWPGRPGIRKVPGDLEAEIMELIWERPAGQGTTVRYIFAVLYERRRTAYTTVMNTMARITRKRLLRVEKNDQAYVYYPTFTRQKFVARFVGRILEDLLVNFSGATLEGLDAQPGQATAAQVRQLLDDIARRREREE